MRSTGKAMLLGLALIWLFAQMTTLLLHHSRMNREGHHSSANERPGDSDGEAHNQIATGWRS
jgi:hypothetical protein